jgi:UPF0716 protein FxsA
MPYLFLIFVVIPLTEIGVFISVGGEIGVAWTLILCVMTAILGGALVRYQGLHTLVSGRERLDAGALPVDALFDGLCIIVAGALLLTPGFVTDTVGFALLVPQFRHLLMNLGSKYGEKHFEMRTGMNRDDMPGPGGNQGRDPLNQPRRGEDIIDVEYERVDDEDDPHTRY